jgi:aminocarboxymuconate-semialdehyde decarboxylase
MSVDIHAHFIPPRFIDELRQSSGRLGVEVRTVDEKVVASIAGGAEIGVLRADLFDLDQRLSAMDRTRVELQVLASWIDLTAYELDGATGASYSRTFNECLAEVVASNPTRFGGLATVPLQAPAQAADELEYAIKSLGLAGVQIGTTIAGEELDSPDLDAFWEMAAGLGCLILLHPFRPLAGRNVSRYMLDNAVGRPGESTIALGHMIFGGVFERFPDLVVCTVHGGGFLPYQIGRMDRAYEAKPNIAGAHLTRAPSEWASHLYYDTVTHDPDVLAFLVGRVGVEHVLMGSDYPFEMGDADPVASVNAVDGLSDSERALIIGGNARRLLRIAQA